MYEEAAVRSSAGDGTGRTAWTITKTIASRTTSGVQILNRRPTVRSAVCGGGGVLVSSASSFSGACSGAAGTGIGRVPSGPTASSGAGAVPGAPDADPDAAPGFTAGGSGAGTGRTEGLAVGCAPGRTPGAGG